MSVVEMQSAWTIAFKRKNEERRRFYGTERIAFPVPHFQAVQDGTGAEGHQHDPAPGRDPGLPGAVRGGKDHHNQDHHRTAAADLRGGQAPGHGLLQHRRVHLRKNRRGLGQQRHLQEDDRMAEPLCVRRDMAGVPGEGGEGAGPGRAWGA